MIKTQLRLKIANSLTQTFVSFSSTKEAQEVYEKALFYDRNNPDIYYNVR